MLKLSIHSLQQLAKVCHALSTPLRLEILQQISDKNLSIAELSGALQAPASTIASNVSILEDAGLIITNIHAAKRGTQRICSKSYADIFINLDPRYPVESEEKHYEIDMPVGLFVDCHIRPTCGLIRESGIIAAEDQPSSFYNPARMEAGLIWFRMGHVTYRFPNDIADFPGLSVKSISFSVELCSEAPNYDMDWPSDITFWINGVEATTWTCPSDYGDRHGKVRSCLHQREFFTQYGQLKTLTVTRRGTFLDDLQVSEKTISDFQLSASAIDFKIGIKQDAVNQGGINLFGAGFGDYNQNIVMKIDYSL